MPIFLAKVSSERYEQIRVKSRGSGVSYVKGLSCTLKKGKTLELFLSSRK